MTRILFTAQGWPLERADVEWVERFGTLGVLLLVVRWFTQRIDARDTQVERMIGTFEAAVEEFKRYNAEESRAHEAILRELAGVREAIDGGPV